MRKTIKLLILTVVTVIALTGCIDESVDISITENSFTFEQSTAVQKNMLDEDQFLEYGNYLKSAQVKKLSDLGINAENVSYTRNGAEYIGGKILYDIDKISANTYKIQAILADMEDDQDAEGIAAGIDYIDTTMATGLLDNGKYVLAYRDYDLAGMNDEIDDTIDNGFAQAANLWTKIGVEGKLIAAASNDITTNNGIVSVLFNADTVTADYAYAIFEISESLHNKLVDKYNLDDSYDQSEFDDDTLTWKDEPEFSDIIGHPKEAYLQNMIDLGVMNGKSPGVMEPDSTVSREEAVTMLNRYFSYGEFSTTGNKQMSDVKNDRWSYESVKWALDNDITDGIGSDGDGIVIFNPTGKLTKEQLSVMIYRTMNYLGVDIVHTLQYIEINDLDTASGWAKDALEFAHERNIIRPDNQGNFEPKRAATRAEFAEMLSLVNYR